MNEGIHRGFELHFPDLAQRMVDDRVDGIYGFIITLDTGEHVLYDPAEHIVRFLPMDSNNMSEEECRLEFGRRLRRKMQSKGITQGMLSEKTGLYQSQISKYMRGETLPGFYAIDRIAKALDCSIDEFRYI